MKLPFEIFHNKLELRCDFALSVLLAEQPDLIELFWPGAASSGQTISEVRLNTMRPSLVPEAPYTDRETDIEIILRGTGGRWLLLIEDKIDAKQQPFQAEDYIAFANNQVAEGVFDRARTVLFAPQCYEDGAFRNFDGRVTYEATIESVESVKSASVVVCCQVLWRYARDFAAATDASMTTFYRDYRALLDEIAPNLALVPTKQRTAGQSNFEFRAEHLPEGYKLIHVSGSGGSNGWIKLQKYAADLNAAETWFEQTNRHPYTRFDRESKSFKIFRELPAIDMKSSVQSQKRSMISCIETIRDFYDWSQTQHLPEF